MITFLLNIEYQATFSECRVAPIVSSATQSGIGDKNKVLDSGSNRDDGQRSLRRRCNIAASSSNDIRGCVLAMNECGAK